MLNVLWLQALFAKYMPALLAVMEPELWIDFILASAAFEKLPLSFSRLFREHSRPLDIKK